MSSPELAQRLAVGLEKTGLVEPVKTNYATDRVSVLCRLGKGAEAEWVKTVTRMLLCEEAEKGEAHSFSLHICKMYFLKEFRGSKSLVFGWNVSVTSSDISTSLSVLIPVIRGADPNRPKGEPGETMEMALPGLEGRVDRNVPDPGKGRYRGVYSAGTNFSSSGRVSRS